MQAALYERIVHDKYCFTGFHLCLCWCQLEILKLKDGRTAVIATELKDNPGTSITNAMEILAATVCLDFGIDVYKLVWIEHYGYPCPVCPTEPRGFDRVEFAITPNSTDGTVFSDVRWRPMQDADWLALDLTPRLAVWY